MRIAYAQDEWTPATLDRYGRDAALRAEPMQAIQPAEWIKQATASAAAVPIDGPAAMKATHKLPMAVQSM